MEKFLEKLDWWSWWRQLDHMVELKLNRKGSWSESGTTCQCILHGNYDHTWEACDLFHSPWIPSNTQYTLVVTTKEEEKRTCMLQQNPPSCRWKLVGGALFGNRHAKYLLCKCKEKSSQMPMQLNSGEGDETTHLVVTKFRQRRWLMRHMKIVGKVDNLREEATEMHNITMLKTNYMYKKETT
jgi:hypothetical protein